MQQAMDWAKVDWYLFCHSASQDDQNKQKKMGDMLLYRDKYPVSYHWYDTQH